MKHEPRSLALLRSANPVSVDPTAVHSTRATALFEQIVAEPRDTAVATGSDGEGNAFVLLAGRVGSAVRSIVIHRSDHVDVIASTKHGWYLAWWPARAHATNATVTTSTGAHEVPLPAFATSGPPSCGGRPNTGCASASL